MSTIMIGEPHPLNFDALQKGDIISAEQIESITQCQRSHRSYQLRVLALKEQIQRELRDRGRVVTIACRKDALHILTDAEAAEYNERAMGEYFRRAGRALYRKIHVDQSQLTDEERKVHQRQIEVRNRQMQALRKVQVNGEHRKQLTSEGE